MCRAGGVYISAMIIYACLKIMINDTSLHSEWLWIEASLVFQLRVRVVSQGSGSESSSYLEFRSK